MEIYRENLRLEKEKLIEQKIRSDREFAAGKEQRAIECQEHLDTVWENILLGEKGVPRVFRYGQRINQEYIDIYLKQKQTNFCIAFINSWNTYAIIRPSKYFRGIYGLNTLICDNSVIFIWPNDATNQEIKDYIDTNGCRDH